MSNRHIVVGIIQFQQNFNFNFHGNRWFRRLESNHHHKQLRRHNRNIQERITKAHLPSSETMAENFSHSLMATNQESYYSGKIPASLCRLLKGIYLLSMRYTVPSYPGLKFLLTGAWSECRVQSSWESFNYNWRKLSKLRVVIWVISSLQHINKIS